MRKENRRHNPPPNGRKLLRPLVPARKSPAGSSTDTTRPKVRRNLLLVPRLIGTGGSSNEPQQRTPANVNANLFRWCSLMFTVVRFYLTAAPAMHWKVERCLTCYPRIGENPDSASCAPQYRYKAYDHSHRIEARDCDGWSDQDSSNASR